MAVDHKFTSLVFFLDEFLCDVAGNKQQITTKCRCPSISLSVKAFKNSYQIKIYPMYCRKIYPTFQTRGGGGGQLAQILGRYVCALAEPKSRPITRTKFFIHKPPKTYKNDMNLLIFLDLTYNPGKNFKFYSLQGQNFKVFLIFTYNQGKVS